MVYIKRTTVTYGLLEKKCLKTKADLSLEIHYSKFSEILTDYSLVLNCGYIFWWLCQLPCFFIIQMLIFDIKHSKGLQVKSNLYTVYVIFMAILLNI